MRIKSWMWICFFTGSIFAQDYYPSNEGVKAKNTNHTAFINAVIHSAPGQTLENGTLLIREGKIVGVGSTVNIPANTVIVDLKGKHIYPSFIDIFSGFGVEKPKRASGQGRSPQYKPTREGFYWNDHIMSENNAVENFKYDDKDAESLRKQGFGVVNTHLHDGIARGTGVLVSLIKEGNDGQRILNGRSAQYFSFDRSVAKRQAYPSSLMGAMALLRQMYYDASWYAKGQAETTDRSLEALNSNKGLTQIFAAGDGAHIIRADGIGDAFGIQYAILAGGNEYENITAVKGTNAPLIVPVNFPEAYDVSNPYEAEYIALKDLRHWNLAPSNPKVLADNNIKFALTLHDLKSPDTFKDMVLKAIEYGLSEDAALNALTTAPASILGKSDLIGSLKPGALANFLITSDTYFKKESVLYENWVLGSRHVIQDMNQKDIRGTYVLNAAGTSYEMHVKGDVSKPKIEIKKDTVTLKSTLAYTGDWVDLTFTNEDGSAINRMTGKVLPESEKIEGRLVLPDGKESKFTATRTETHKEDEKESEEASEPKKLMSITYPNVGYGYNTKPKAEDLLFTNATVWTNTSEGILEGTDVLVSKGKIARIGQSLNPGNARVIDAKGKHLTTGIIDEHSHIAALAINESGHNSTAEVKMSDVLDPKDIDIYRNLAGGVTSIQLLHGSANPIGGRSAILKLKWGEDERGLLFPGAPKFIKFALGENVKQSNWQSFERFPQTRMGVEQVFINYFQRAREYDNAKKSGASYRYDEEMEVLAEILNGERFVSCHSYVQSEINMLMKVAEKFDFRINTFTHILEGYKVADKMAAHGVGGSTFSDWWAYKFEVNDAIPYNAAIMAKQGVTVAINSDDAEMSRRLNQEAAKTVKYGGLSEEEAWKTVTLNPAKLLHIDHRVGSIAVGKDADLVLWTDHPLSVYARAEKTIIEGATYFDMERDKAQREAIRKERAALIGMMLIKDDTKSKRTPTQNKKEEFHCDSE